MNRPDDRESFGATSEREGGSALRPLSILIRLCLCFGFVRIYFLHPLRGQLRFHPSHLCQSSVHPRRCLMALETLLSIVVQVAAVWVVGRAAVETVQVRPQRRSLGTTSSATRRRSRAAKPV
eukprot:2197762-Pyramimonas_sp.AAC.1